MAISDTHNRHSELTIPPCHILIHAGDYSFRGSQHEIHEFYTWLNKQPAKHKVSVQGNHEVWVQKNFYEARLRAEELCPGVHFLEHGAIEIEGIKIFGSAWTPWFHDWAWNALRGQEISTYWKQIPDDTNILVTHGPPRGILDTVVRADGTPRESVGCDDLLARVKELKDLKLHIFGHIHSGSGKMQFNGVKFVNASICDEQYGATNKIKVIKYDK